MKQAVRGDLWDRAEVQRSFGHGGAEVICLPDLQGEGQTGTDHVLDGAGGVQQVEGKSGDEV